MVLKLTVYVCLTSFMSQKPAGVPSVDFFGKIFNFGLCSTVYRCFNVDYVRDVTVTSTVECLYLFSFIIGKNIQTFMVRIICVWGLLFKMTW